MTGRRHYRKAKGDAYADAGKGYLLGVDYIGKYTPDVDGNMYAMTGVEMSTRYGMVVLTKDCKAETSIAGVGKSNRVASAYNRQPAHAHA